MCYLIMYSKFYYKKKKSKSVRNVKISTRGTCYFTMYMYNSKFYFEHTLVKIQKKKKTCPSQVSKFYENLLSICKQFSRILHWIRKLIANNLGFPDVGYLLKINTVELQWLEP